MVPHCAGTVVARSSASGSLESRVVEALAASGFKIRVVDYSSPFSLKLSSGNPDQPPLTIGLFEESKFCDPGAAPSMFVGRLARQVNAYAIVPLSVLHTENYATFQNAVLAECLGMGDSLGDTEAPLAASPASARRCLTLLPCSMTPGSVLSVVLALFAAGSRNRAVLAKEGMARVAAELAGVTAAVYVLEGIPGVRASTQAVGADYTGAPSATTGSKRARVHAPYSGVIADAAAAAVAAGDGKAGSVQCARPDMLLDAFGAWCCDACGRWIFK